MLIISSSCKKLETTIQIQFALCHLSRKNLYHVPAVGEEPTAISFPSQIVGGHSSAFLLTGGFLSLPCQQRPDLVQAASRTPISASHSSFVGNLGVGMRAGLAKQMEGDASGAFWGEYKKVAPAHHLLPPPHSCLGATSEDPRLHVADLSVPPEATPGEMRPAR